MAEFDAIPASSLSSGPLASNAALPTPTASSAVQLAQQRLGAWIADATRGIPFYTVDSADAQWTRHRKQLMAISSHVQLATG